MAGTEPYEAPNQMNMHLSMRHLTNYSLNKRSQKFEHCNSDIYGENFSSKRPLTVCLRQLSEEHPDFDEEIFYSDVPLSARSGYCEGTDHVPAELGSYGASDPTRLQALISGETVT